MDKENYEYVDHENYSLYEDIDEDYPTICEKEEVRSFAKVFLPVIYALALVVGLAGNSLLVGIYVYYKKLRTMTDVHILNLAVADLLLLLTLPFWAADAVVGWELGEAMCKVTAALYSMNFSGGMLFLACISVDRYLAVSKPGGFRATSGRHRVVVCLAVWVTAFLLGLPDTTFSTVTQMTAKKACIPIYPASMGFPAKATLEVLEVVLSFLLPCLVMLFCYGRLARVLHRFPEARQGKKWRAFKVLLAVVGVFLVTQLPYNVVKFCRAMDVLYALVTHCETSKSLDRALQVTESLALTHSCLNPMVYAFLGSSFRQYILRLVKGFGQWRRHRREQQVVEISLNSHSSSEETSKFTI